jgi:hypothetical protein
MGVENDQKKAAFSLKSWIDVKATSDLVKLSSMYCQTKKKPRKKHKIYQTLISETFQFTRKHISLL